MERRGGKGQGEALAGPHFGKVGREANGGSATSAHILFPLLNPAYALYTKVIEVHTRK